MSDEKCATCEWRNREIDEGVYQSHNRCTNRSSGNYGSKMVANAVCDKYEKKKQFVFIVSRDSGITYTVEGSFDNPADSAIDNLFDVFQWPNYRSRLIMRPEFVVKKTQEEQKNESREHLQESVEKLRNKFCK